MTWYMPLLAPVEVFLLIHGISVLLRAGYCLKVEVKVEGVEVILFQDYYINEDCRGKDSPFLAPPSS
jgi:hypothetical protein